MERITFVQAGFGFFGEGWTDLLLRSADVELCAVVDPSKEAKERFMKRFGDRGIPFFSTLSEALRETKPQAILIVTPNAAHREVAEEALAAGLHILSEKPLADTWRNALAIYALWARTPHLVYVVSQNYRFRSEIRALKKALLEGRCGTIEYVTYEFHETLQLGGWRISMEHPLLADMSVHHFDILRFVLEKEPLSVRIESMNPSWSPFQSDTVASGTLIFDPKVLVHYFGSWVTRGYRTGWNGVIRFFGSEGTLTLENDRIFFEDKEGKREEVRFSRYQTDGRPFVLQEFVQAVRSGREAETSLSDNIKTFALACAAVESAQRHEEVKLQYYFEDLKNVAKES
ncbi:Gfo/Idh/MocA family protein [Candidatus Caldatribacterium sp.]|uniref:Gfo/Idh/MocA family protein n=1 Tax=Candidatus Caldatribacterium sp. TaxID=2282143 RepID=UPI0029932958|nr:Gfo/Idh/MocA family oxidoreductase [Candidatus Caldatribacterium sp.]MDW8081918.1 Gfo/Idh/MocA family oxidoreductase [Candidatus Calescibacterium sp.]